LLAPQAAKAIPIPIEWGEHISRVQKLPQTEKFTAKVGDKVVHVDVGVRYKRFSVVWIPIWHYGEKEYVLYHSSLFGETRYWHLTPKGVVAINEKLGCSLPQKPKIPFWSRWGVRLFVLLAVILLVRIAESSEKKEAAAATPANS
jgi:hypothetical protein